VTHIDAMQGSLDNRLFDDDTTIDNADKLELMYNIASGISHLHANKIIHRDLAARNILLSHGIAKVAVSDTSALSTLVPNI
jgi:serine/threonine protein kinase